MKTLVNDGPSEPLFTPTPEVQPQQPAYQPAAARSRVINLRSISRYTISLCRRSRSPIRLRRSPSRNNRYKQASACPPAPQESLIHPLLMRNGDSRPLQSRPRHCRRWICLPRRRVKSSRWIPLLSSRWHWWKRDSPISALKRMW